MRDPAVHAIYALHLTPSEVAAVREGCPVYRPYWPPVCCRDSVVGLSAGGEGCLEHALERLTALGVTAETPTWDIAALLKRQENGEIP